jgi:hypothetical protein
MRGWYRNRLGIRNVCGLEHALVYTHESDFRMRMRMVTALVMAGQVQSVQSRFTVGWCSRDDASIHAWAGAAGVRFNKWADAAGVRFTVGWCSRCLYICYRQVRFNSGLIQPVYSGMIVLVIFIDRRHDKTTVLEG